MRSLNELVPLYRFYPLHVPRMKVRESSEALHGRGAVQVAGNVNRSFRRQSGGNSCFVANGAGTN
jgi:hypothetical protein